MKRSFTLIEVIVVVAVIIFMSLAIWHSVNGQPEIDVIDGCQYIVTRDFNGNKSRTHKGNCNNPIHQYNAERP